MGADTQHSTIDPEGVQKRTASRQVEQQDRLDRMEPVLMVVDARTTRMETKLDVAMGLIRPWHERYAPLALVVLLAVFVATYLTRTTASARVSAPTSVETARR